MSVVTRCAVILVLLAALTTHQLHPEDVPSPEEPPVPPLGLRFGFGAGLQNIRFPLDSGASPADTGTLGSDELVLSPNTPLYMVLGVSWRSLGVGLRLNLPDTVPLQESRGETQFTNLQLQLYGQRYAADLLYQNHRGMYIENAGAFAVPIPEIRVPDMELETVGVTFLWSRNPRVNLATAYKLDSVPTRSRAGILWLASLNRITLDAATGPGGTVPALDGSVWGSSMKLETYSAVAGVGATTMLTYASVFFSPLVALGLGAQRTDYSVLGDSNREWAVVPQLSVRASAGYNAPGWYLALLFSADLRNVQTPFLQAVQGSTRIDLVFGRRYTMKRWQGTRGLSLR